MRQQQIIPQRSLIHSFTCEGKTFIFNGENLAFAMVPPQLVEILQEFAGCRLQDVAEFLRRTDEKTLGALNCLFDGGFFEGRDFSSQYAFEKKRHSADHSLSSVHLEVSAACNLSCKYCYADGGSFSGTQPKGFMSVGTAAHVARFLFERAREECWMNVLGGEPLLNPNVFKIIDLFLENSEKHRKQVHIQFSTNGTLLNDAAARFLAERGIRIAVSLDGEKVLHDMARHDRLGRGSFDAALAGLRAVAKVNVSLAAVRVTCCRHNVHRVGEFHDFILREVGDILLDISPVIVSDPDSPLALREEDLEIYKVQARNYSRHTLLRRVRKLDEILFAFHQSAITRQQAQLFHCSPGWTSLAFSVDGTIYPCCSFMQWDEMKMGKVRAGDFHVPEAVRRMLDRRAVLEREKCGACWAKYLCSGGCLGINYGATGDASETDDYLCDTYRTIEEAKLLGFADAWLLTRTCWQKWRGEGVVSPG